MSSLTPEQVENLTKIEEAFEGVDENATADILDKERIFNNIQEFNQVVGRGELCQVLFQKYGKSLPEDVLSYLLDVMMKDALIIAKIALNKMQAGEKS